MDSNGVRQWLLTDNSSTAKKFSKSTFEAGLPTQVVRTEHEPTVLSFMLTPLSLCTRFMQYNCLGQAHQCGAPIKGCNADDAVVCSTNLFARCLQRQRASESVVHLLVLVFFFFSLYFICTRVQRISVILRAVIVLLSLTARQGADGRQSPSSGTQSNFVTRRCYDCQVYAVPMFIVCQNMTRDASASHFFFMYSFCALFCAD